MDFDERTTQQIMHIASIGQRNPDLLSLEDIRSVCGSVLTQAPAHRPYDAPGEPCQHPSALNPFVRHLLEDGMLPPVATLF